MGRLIDTALRLRARLARLPRPGAARREEFSPPRPMPSIGVGILTYNRPTGFRQVVDAAVEQFAGVADIYVYNDGSSPNDEYRRIFAELPPDVCVIDASENRGVAHGKNALLRAMEGHDFSFLMEDDLVPTSPRAVTDYVAASLRTGIEHFNFAHHGSANEAGPIRVVPGMEYYRECVGAWSMYTRRAIDTVGLMDEGFHNAWEHVEHTYRLAAAGFTSPFGEFADVPGSRRWVRELPHGIESSTIRNDPDWQRRMRTGLEYWATKDPNGFPFRRLLRKLRANRVRPQRTSTSPNEVVVAIPVYKPKLSPSERLSFEQCLRVLGSHPITLVAPSGLSLADYDPQGNGLRVHRFDPDYFHHPRTYNRLMLSPVFYRAFLRFRFVLIYQLDAFVFTDQLSHWCRQDYDYIGAPWIDADWFDDLPIRRPPWSQHNVVGNGGFSLRKTRTCWALATLLRPAALWWPANEDGFWSFYVPSYWPLFRIPSTEEALRFSYERSPAKCFELGRKTLPFGCHAWEKYEPEFWRRHIPSLRPTDLDPST